MSVRMERLVDMAGGQAKKIENAGTGPSTVGAGKIPNTGTGPSNVGPSKIPNAGTGPSQG